MSERWKNTVKPGGHSVNIKSGDIGGFGISSDAYSIIAEPNKNYFFIIDLDQGFFSSSWKITETSEQGFRKALN